MDKYILSLDPGFFTGYALIKNRNLIPEKTGVLRCKTGSHWSLRQTDLVEKLNTFIEETFGLSNAPDYYKNITAYIELPSFRQDSVGLSCATGRNGEDSDLVVLSCLVGRYYELLDSWGIKVVTVPVNQWKGSLHKNEGVINRINRRAGKDLMLKNHEGDAVGICYWAMGVFKPKSISDYGPNPRKRNKPHVSKSGRVYG